MDARIRRCCVGLDRTLLDAIRVIDAGSFGIALVLDAEGRLEGLLTDGDVRRALLKGVALESPLKPHIRRPFTSVGVESGRAEVLDLMQARSLRHIPVLDRDGRLVGVHLLQELLGAVERPHWAVVLAGGRGARLGPITDHTPKPMVRVAGRPILERLVLHLVGYGLRRIFLSVNYLAGRIEEHFGDGSKFGCRIEYLKEREPLGTGGPLSLLPEKPSHPLLVLNGDLVTQANLGELLEYHARGRFVATMGVRPYAHPVPYGCVEIEAGRVVRLEEKPVLERIVNAGLYALEPDLLERIPRGPYPITSLFETCLGKGEPVGAFEISEEWIDVGVRDHLRQARQGSP